jgi:hypothetical protein
VTALVALNTPGAVKPSNVTAAVPSDKVPATVTPSALKMVIVLASAFVPRKSTAAIVALANVALAKTSTIRMRMDDAPSLLIAYKP